MITRLRKNILGIIILFLIEIISSKNHAGNADTIIVTEFNENNNDNNTKSILQSESQQRQMKRRPVIIIIKLTFVYKRF